MAHVSLLDETLKYCPCGLQIGPLTQYTARYAHSWTVELKAKKEICITPQPAKTLPPKYKSPLISPHSHSAARYSHILALGTRIGNEAGKNMTPAGWASLKSWWPLAKTKTPPSTETPSGYDELRLEKFWHNIIANFCNGEKARASEQGLQFFSWMKGFDPCGFEDEASMAGYSPDVQDCTSYMASFQQATTNRRFFVTENGRMGLAPLDSEPGDLVCLILGSPVPFILRPCRRDIDPASSSPHALEPKPHQPEECFVLVGECYCHGMMEGEELKPPLLRDLILIWPSWNEMIWGLLPDGAAIDIRYIMNVDVFIIDW